jgi:hypothetical protein
LDDGEGSPTFEEWLGKMKRKVINDSAVWPTDAMKVDYIQDRCTGIAAAFLEPLHFDTPDEIFAALTTRFRDRHRVARARIEFRRLRHKKGDSFQPFYADFVRLATEGGQPKDQWKELVREKLPFEIEAHATLQFSDSLVNFDELMGYLSDLSFTFERQAQVTQAAEQRKKPATNQGRDQNSRQSQQMTPQTSQETDRETLRAEGRCFKCRGLGHRFWECPEITKKEDYQPPKDQPGQ